MNGGPERVRVAVVDPLPLFAHGLVELLRAHGREAAAPEDVAGWVRTEGTDLVLISVVRDEDWATARELTASRPGIRLVLLLDDPGPAAHLRAVTAGAAGVLPRAATPAAVLDVVDAAVKGYSLLPLDVLRGMLTECAGGGSGLQDREIDWLRRLAGGSTVARLAHEVGYSERMMFRLLSEMYGKLGVTGRTGALMYARDRGWL
ncbi:hypothetical protein [Actinoplanes sp. NPDC049681]|uniref:hypothetical protein n=1 Tax=Actinoplanes sp. NPDC049681 TaxID=3363905 RepID=UPI0037890256